MLSGELEDVSGHKPAHLGEDRLKVLVLGRDLHLSGRLIKGTILEDVVKHVCLVHGRPLAVENGKYLQNIGTDIVRSMVKLLLLEVLGFKNLSKHAAWVLKASPGLRVELMRECLESDCALASRLLLSNLNLVNHLLDIGAYEWQLVLKFSILIEACSIRCSKILEFSRR